MRIKLIFDGDVSGGIMLSLPGTGIDMLLGIGGPPEAVLTAAALKCLGGDIQCRRWARNAGQRDQVTVGYRGQREAHVDFTHVLVDCQYRSCVLIPEWFGVLRPCTTSTS